MTATEEDQLEALRAAGFTAVVTLDGLRFTREDDPGVYTAEEATALLAADEEEGA